MLYLVRHGQTAANAAGLLLGRADPPLTDLGRRQARAIADALPAPARVVSSPLSRARDTAAAFGQRVEIDERWVEMDYGELDGRPVGYVSAEVWSRWRADPAFAPSGGESLTAVGDRVRSACTELAESADGRDVVVVSHVSPIKAAIAWALGVTDAVAWRMFVEDAAVARVEIGPPAPVLRSFNEVYPST
ncbi:MAG TPA: histidine phosphatase family protein [Jiangellaceae bacterium]|nr:histidine phosphatase family protein [Jiangellaceae bacterium]